jgi:hypothetical protein
MRRGDPIEREHLLHRVGVAEEHHDFLEVRTTHGVLLRLRLMTRGVRIANR